MFCFFTSTFTTLLVTALTVSAAPIQNTEVKNGRSPMVTLFTENVEYFFCGRRAGCADMKLGRFPVDSTQNIH
eukprot:Pgem_evm1s9601